MSQNRIYISLCDILLHTHCSRCNIAFQFSHYLCTHSALRFVGLTLSRVSEKSASICIAWNKHLINIVQNVVKNLCNIAVFDIKRKYRFVNIMNSWFLTLQNIGSDSGTFKQSKIISFGKWPHTFKQTQNSKSMQFLWNMANIDSSFHSFETHSTKPSLFLFCCLSYALLPLFTILKLFINKTASEMSVCHYCSIIK